jgi:hypothetical protein
MNYIKKPERKKSKKYQPLVVLNTPSPTIGWANAERTSLSTRLKADLVLHSLWPITLQSSNNVP